MGVAVMAQPAGRGGLSVRARLAAAVAVLLVLMSALVMVAVNAMGDLHAAQRQVAGKAVPYLQGVSDAALAAKSAANDERGFLLSGDAKFAKEAVERRRAQSAGLAEARAASVTAAQTAAVDAIVVALAEFNAALDREFALFGRDPDGARKLSGGPNRDLRKVYEARFADATDLARKQVAAATQASDRLAARSRTMLLGTLALMVALGAAVAVLLARSISRPLTAAVLVLEAAAAGDLTSRAEVRGAAEFRRMAAAVNGMLTATADTVRTIAGSATALVDTARDVTRASDEIADSAESAATKAGAASAGATQVSASAQAVSVAAEEMDATIGGISSAVTLAATVAAEAIDSADAARAAVTALDTSSQQIGAVVKIITSIAEQTNLLALNATIEAARAGDAGKGFAVVAGEVKDLAQETAKATSEIVSQVGAIQGDTSRAVEAIGHINRVIAEIGNHQTAIASSVEEQSATTGEMSRSISEIAAGATGISASVTDVAGAAAGTAGSLQRTRDAAAALGGMADELRQLIHRFRY
jgi:methyl-accepting chemotaxis protein